jgi:phosphonoacetaldehyde hydrolase
VSAVQACVKIDDTIPGVEEGLNAGMWTVGLAVSGNEVGMLLDEWRALAKADQEAKRGRAYTRMAQCGAHYVVDSIADIMPCIEEIQARIRRGEAP